MNTVDLACIGCGLPVAVPEARVKKVGRANIKPLCKRTECVAGRAERLLLAQAVPSAVTAPRDEKPKTSIHVAVETSSGLKSFKVDKRDEGAERETDIEKDKRFIEKVKQPAGIKSGPQALVPSSDPNAPFGLDDAGRPIQEMRSDVKIYDAVLAQKGGFETAQSDILTGTLRTECDCDQPYCRICHPDSIIPLNNDGTVASVPIAIPEVKISQFDGLVADIAERRVQPKTYNKTIDYRTMFNIGYETILGWLDAPIPGEMKEIIVYGPKVLKDDTPLREQIEVLLAQNAEDESFIVENDLTPREEKATQKQIQARLFEIFALRKQLRNWKKVSANHESTGILKKTPMLLRDKIFPFTQTFSKDEDEADIEFSVANYLVVHGLDSRADDILRFTGWTPWHDWENAVILASMKYHIYTPDPDIVALYPELKKYEPENEEIDHNEEEALIRKTGGASIGASGIRGAGQRNGRARKLESFDKVLDYGRGGGNKPGGDYEGGSWHSDMDSGGIDQGDNG